MHRSTTQPPIVTVAVVSWNTRELLLACLESLASEVSAGRAQVWVVDNGSSDGSAQAARERAPWAHVIEAQRNLGFGRAVNLVARSTESEWLVAANADVALEPGALEGLLEASSDDRAGCLAPRLILPDGSTQHSVYPLPTVPFTLAFNLGLHRLTPRVADRLCLEGFWDAERAREVPWAIGAFLLLRRAAFDAVGGFDERQWMYAEDLDLGWRMRAAGWTTRYEPSARVRHQAGAATGPAFGEETVARFMAATYGALLRRRGLARTWTTAALNVAGAAGRLAWMVPLARVSTRWRGRRDETRGWLAANLQGLASPSQLLRPAGPPE
jgi:N-acetylglucosaminyl-diphospho-decaprenol L-rhamnosyltransferase